jgi:hypothetical protein
LNAISRTSLSAFKTLGLSPLAGTPGPMSVGRKTAKYAAAAAVLSVVIIAASFLYIGIPTGIINSLTGHSSSYQGPQSTLVIQLTDPPHVPALTSSLNLTYTSLALLVGEPTGTQGQMVTTTDTVTPSGGSATVDLLRLQNVSQTIASANLPNGSVIYSVTFAVSSISIDVNGTVSSVSLASGGGSFGVTMAEPSMLHGTNVALLQLNPVVVDTPTGYQLIPSAVGVIRPAHGQGEEVVGSEHPLSTEDQQNLDHAAGNVSASLVMLAVSGNTTSVTVQVNNTGSVPIELNAIGLHGNFTVYGNVCQTSTSTTESHTTTGDHETSTTSVTHTESYMAAHMCEFPEHTDQVVFVPVVQSQDHTSTTSSSSSTTTASNTCSAGQMSLVNGNVQDGQDRGLSLSPGQCVNLTFAGKIMFGDSHFVLVPSTAPGQTYIVHIIASNGANMQISCSLPLGAASCKALPQSQQNQD